jgi:hypothetical protein
MRSRTARLDRRVAALGDPSGYPTVSAPGRAALDADGRDRLRSLPPASARSYCGNACTLATEWSDAARPPRVAGVSEMRLADRGLRAGLVRRSPGRGGADVLAAAGMQPGADRIALACRVCRGRRHPWWLTPRRSRVTPRMLRWSAGRTRWCRRSCSARRRRLRLHAQQRRVVVVVLAAQVTRVASQDTRPTPTHGPVPAARAPIGHPIRRLPRPTQCPDSAGRPRHS